MENKTNIMSEILDELWFSRHPYDVLFLELFQGYKIEKPNKNKLVYKKDGHILMRYYKDSKSIFINYEMVWSVFEVKYKFDFDKISKMMCDMFKTHFKLEGKVSYMLEEVIKIEGTLL